MTLVLLESQWPRPQKAASTVRVSQPMSTTEADIPAMITTPSATPRTAAVSQQHHSAVRTTAPLKKGGSRRTTSRRRRSHRHRRSTRKPRTSSSSSNNNNNNIISNSINHHKKAQSLQQLQHQQQLIQRQLQLQQHQMSLAGLQMQNVLIPSSITIPLPGNSTTTTPSHRVSVTSTEEEEEGQSPPSLHTEDNEDEDAASHVGSVGTLDVTVSGLSSIGTIGMSSVIDNNNNNNNNNNNHAAEDDDNVSEASFFDQVVQQNQLKANNNSKKQNGKSKKAPKPQEQQQQQQQPQEEEEDLASQATSMGTIDATLNCGASSVGTIGTKLLDGMDEDDDDIDVDNPKDEEDDDDDESEASFFNNVVQRNQLDKETQKPTSQHRFPTSIQCRPPPRQVSVPTTTVAAATGNNNDDDDDDATGTASIATLEFSAIGSIGTTPSMSQGLEGSSSNHHHHHHHGQDDNDDDKKVDATCKVMMMTPSPPQRVLSIQSHVVSGYVGNKSATFPLQLLGLDVDVVNSVQFSNHTGYPGGWEGHVLKGDQLRQLLAGLQRNHLTHQINHVLTGYIGSESFLEAVVDVVQGIRNRQKTNRNHQPPQQQPQQQQPLRYVCDPVLGDDGKFYVPSELVQVYKQRVIPIADVVTPNQFETEQLTGISIASLPQARTACNALHAMGPSLVVITSLVLPDHPETLTVVASWQRQEKQEEQPDHNNNTSSPPSVWSISCPVLPGRFTGTGDLFAALLLAHTCTNAATTHKDNASVLDLPRALEQVVNTMYAVIERTHRYASSGVVVGDAVDKLDDNNDANSSGTATTRARELQLIQSKRDIECPPQRFRAVELK